MQQTMSNINKVINSLNKSAYWHKSGFKVLYTSTDQVYIGQIRKGLQVLRKEEKRIINGQLKMDMLVEQMLYPKIWLG